MLVPILKAGTPHQDAVVEQCPVAFSEVVHFFHHIGELCDVEGGDLGDLINLLDLVFVMRLGVMLILEPEFRIRNTVWGGADVGADPSGVGLKSQHGEVAHHLHIFAALLSVRNFYLDRWGIRAVAFAHTEAGRL